MPDLTISEIIRKRTDLEIELARIFNDHIVLFQKNTNMGVSALRCSFTEITDLGSESLTFIVDNLHIQLTCQGEGGERVTLP